MIGGGAAGFFGAIAAAEARPGARVLLLEKSPKLLSKVRVSGGGRCNVAPACYEVSELLKHYPRGGKALRTAFRRFGPRETVAWFEERGVRLKTEADGRIFPVTDSSETIIACLLDAARRAGVVVRTGAGVKALRPERDAHGTPNGFKVELESGESLRADRVLVATGGHPKAASYAWLNALDHRIEPPVPSLFTFNVPGSPLDGLPGVAVAAGSARAAGEATLAPTGGPLLVTHWGFSGPAVLKLSAWGARRFAERDYQFTALLGWTDAFTEDTLRAELSRRRQSHARRAVMGDPLPGVPARLWARLAEVAGIDAEVRWADLPAKLQNRLLENILRLPVEVRGKTTFKEEFVTCGGVALTEVDLVTFGSRIVPGLYFAGEVLDIDAVTGGYNFQAAWTTGWLAGQAMAEHVRGEHG